MRVAASAVCAIALAVAGGCSRVPDGYVSHLDAPAHRVAENSAAFDARDPMEERFEQAVPRRRATPKPVTVARPVRSGADVTTTASIGPDGDRLAGQPNEQDRRLEEAFQRGSAVAKSICSGC